MYAGSWSQLRTTTPYLKHPSPPSSLVSRAKSLADARVHLAGEPRVNLLGELEDVAEERVAHVLGGHL